MEQRQQSSEQASRQQEQQAASTGEASRQQEQQAASTGQAQRTATGELVRADASEIVLRQEGGQPDLRLKVDAGTPVMVGGEQRSTSDLQEGMQVRASYEDQQGEPRALRIEAQESSGARSSGSPSGMGSPSSMPEGTGTGTQGPTTSPGMQGGSPSSESGSTGSSGSGMSR